MSEEEKIKLKRRLNMQKISFEADLKKVKRSQLTLLDDMRRLKQDRDRVDVYIKNNEDKNKKSIEKEAYINDEIKRIKKKLIELK